jgi:hypothetical protein
MIAASTTANAAVKFAAFTITCAAAAASCGNFTYLINGADEKRVLDTLPKMPINRPHTELPVSTYTGYGTPVSPGRSTAALWRKSQETTEAMGTRAIQTGPRAERLYSSINSRTNSRPTSARNATRHRTKRTIAPAAPIGLPASGP